MADLTQLKCKQCGAPLGQLPTTDGAIRCKYCKETMTFDVPRREQPTQQASQIIYQVVPPQEQQHYAMAPRYGNKSRGVAILSTFFLGYFGIQYFYLNQIGLGVVCLLFCWTFIPCLLALILFIRLLCMDDTSFNEAYNRIA